ncbi:thioredoxin family protein [Leptobacterium sp. I13]|uniref:thioredoxin family protein n=1 Tax=Leptobacterium meishanense TaxID=3128904 RepID=UPI0030EEE065
MKTLRVFILFIVLMGTSVHAQSGSIEWLTWTEAEKRATSDTIPKKIFIDIYTDWCGWCKRMDKVTFNNPKVAEYMNKNFYMVKLHGEGKEAIEFRGTTFEYIPQGRRGYHELAAVLMQGRIAYPTTIFLDEDYNMLSPLPGYYEPDEFLKVAKYFGDNIYKEKEWSVYDGSK